MSYNFLYTVLLSPSVSLFLDILFYVVMVNEIDSSIFLSDFSLLVYRNAGGSDSKVSACNAGDSGSIPGYSPWGHKESDMTEQLHFLSLSIHHCNKKN